MDEQSTAPRRALLATGVAIGATLAGCSDTTDSSESDDDEGTSGSDSTAGATGTPEGSGTGATSDNPTADATFSYPDGTNADGVTPTLLFSTHESALSHLTSIRVTETSETDWGAYTTTSTGTTLLGPSGLLYDTESQDRRTVEWSPAEDEQGYVQMTIGSDTRYRIDNDHTPTDWALGTPRFERILRGFTWSSASAPTERSSRPTGVTYEATGVGDEEALLRTVGGDHVTDATATMTVTERGLITDLSYDIAVDARTDQEGQQVTYTLEDIDSATVTEPEWAATARSEGIQFDLSLTDDRTAVVLEQVNGEAVSTGTEIRLSTPDGVAIGQFETPVEVGDTVYLGQSTEDALLVGRDEQPDQGAPIEDFVFVTFRSNDFLVFSGELTLDGQ